jgi:hypothetical protein
VPALATLSFRDSELIILVAVDAAEEPVHHPAVVLQVGLEFLPVHGLGGAAGKPCYLLDRHALSDSSETLCATGPEGPSPCRTRPARNVLGHLPAVPRAQQRTGDRSEYPAGLLSTRANCLPLSRLIRLSPGAPRQSPVPVGAPGGTSASSRLPGPGDLSRTWSMHRCGSRCDSGDRSD